MSPITTRAKRHRQARRRGVPRRHQASSPLLLPHVGSYAAAFQDPFLPGPAGPSSPQRSQSADRSPVEGPWADGAVRTNNQGLSVGATEGIRSHDARSYSAPCCTVSTNTSHSATITAGPTPTTPLPLTVTNLCDGMLCTLGYSIFTF